MIIKMKVRLSTAFLSFVSFAAASQPLAPSPVEAPLRDLTWGQLNFLHTTDTHGWHAGHLQEYVQVFTPELRLLTDC
jgi:2',3'-cyclic-nucleotide 2'-phosphodiesterase (5'-nucleotidase family)